MEEKETFAAFRRIAEQLRTGTRASRTTIRVDCDALGLEMETVAVESRDESAPTLRDGAAVRWLATNRRTFVMEDCLNPWDPEVAPENYVIGLYGIRSEMVAGVFRRDAMVGIISVHFTRGARTWSDEEVAMIEAACREVRTILEDLEAE